MTNFWKDIKFFYENFKDLSSIQISNFFSAGIYAIFWLFMANELGPEQYGEVNFLIATGTFVFLLANLGTSSTMGVYVPKKVPIESVLYFISIISAIIASITIFLFVSDLGTSILVLGLMISSVSIGEILGNKLFSSYSKLYLIQKILGVVFALIFYYTIGYEGIIIGIGLSHFLFLKQFITGLKKSKISFSILKPRLKFLVNSYLIDVISAIGSVIDKIIVAPLLGFLVLGNYVLGLQFIAIITLFSTSISSYVGPFYASGIEKQKLRRITILISILLSMLALVLTPYIIPLFFPDYLDSIPIIQILCLVAIPNTINDMYKTRFYGYEKNVYITLGTILGLGVQIPLIVFLGKSYGIHGVAWGMLISSAFGCIYSLIINQKLSNEGAFN